MAGFYADREGLTGADRDAFVLVCQRFLRRQRLRRLEPHFIFGAASLCASHLAVWVSMLATAGDEPLPVKRVVAYAVVLAAGSAGALLAARLAWLEDRRHTGRHLGEAWSHYRLRARRQMAREMPGSLGARLSTDYLDPWGSARRS